MLRMLIACVVSIGQVLCLLQKILLGSDLQQKGLVSVMKMRLSWLSSILLSGFFLVGQSQKMFLSIFWILLIAACTMIFRGAVGRLK